MIHHFLSRDNHNFLKKFDCWILNSFRALLARGQNHLLSSLSASHIIKKEEGLITNWYTKRHIYNNTNRTIITITKQTNHMYHLLLTIRSAYLFNKPTRGVVMLAPRDLCCLQCFNNATIHCSLGWLAVDDDKSICLQRFLSSGDCNRSKTSLTSVSSVSK